MTRSPGLRVSMVKRWCTRTDIACLDARAQRSQLAREQLIGRLAETGNARHVERLVFRRDLLELRGQLLLLLGGDAAPKLAPRLRVERPRAAAPCPCGSGKKYKACCLGAERSNPEESLWRTLNRIDADLARTLLAHVDRALAAGAVQTAVAEFYGPLLTAAVADEAPVPSRVTSPWTSSLPPPSRSPASGRPAGTRPRSGGATSNPPGGSRTHGERGVSKVTTRHDQHSTRREQRLEPQTVRQRLPGPNRQVQLAREQLIERLHVALVSHLESLGAGTPRRRARFRFSQ